MFLYCGQNECLMHFYQKSQVLLFSFGKQFGSVYQNLKVSATFDSAVLFRKTILQMCSKK